MIRTNFACMWRLPISQYLQWYELLWKRISLIQLVTVQEHQLKLSGVCCKRVETSHRGPMDKASASYSRLSAIIQLSNLRWPGIVGSSSAGGSFLLAEHLNNFLSILKFIQPNLKKTHYQDIAQSMLYSYDILWNT